MSKDITSLDITPKVIGLGESVVPLASVTRAGVVVQHPLRAIGIWFLAVAGILFVYEALSPFGPGLRFPPKASVVLWAMCGLSALGVFMFAFAQRRLVIATADGGRIALPPTDAQFAAAVTNCIRDAIEHGNGASPHYRVDLLQKSIATLSGVPAEGHAGTMAMPAGPPADAAAAMQPGLAGPTAILPGMPGMPGMPQGGLPPAGHGGQRPAGHGGHGGQQPAGYPASMAPGAAGGGLGLPFGAARESAAASTGQSASGAPYRNGAADQQMPFDRDLVRRLDGVAAGQPAQQHGAPAGAINGMSHMPGPSPLGRVPAAPIALAPDDGGLRDLAALMQLVDRANLQHKEALLDLLRVVEDHKRGGATSREDARAHWQSFADYVQQYLGNIDGLPEATQRFSRAMDQGPASTGFRL